jgi:hypothetical protein
MYMSFFGYIEEFLKYVLFSTLDKGAVFNDRYTDTRTSWGCSGRSGSGSTSDRSPGG